MKKIFCLVILLFVSILLVVSCSRSKEPAQAAIKSVEDTINVAKSEVGKIVPDDIKALEDTLASIKVKFTNGDYKIALEEATALSVKAKTVLETARIKKQQLTAQWTEMSQQLPGMLEQIEAKIENLSKVKKLPAKITKEVLEEARNGLVSIREEWTKAQASFSVGNMTDATNLASSLKDKALKIMESLGINASSTETPQAPEKAGSAPVKGSRPAES